MPTYSGTTLSNLKTATGIASNNLFDHAPGSPSAVSFGDFLVQFIGRDIGSSAYEQGSVTDGSGDIPPWDTNLSIPDTNVLGTSGLPTGKTGQLNSSGEFVLDGSDVFQQGDIIWVRVDADCGEYARQQIIVDQLTQNPTGLNVLAVEQGTVNGQDVVDFKLEVDGFDAIALNSTFADGGYNQHAINYNTQLNFNSTDVETATVYLELISAQWDDTGPNGTGVACDGSTALDNLFGTGTAGDDNYGIKVTVSVNDPTDKYGDVWAWVYFDDANASPPDSTDNIYTGSGGSVSGPVPADNVGCGHFRSGTLLPNNDYNIYVYVTENEDGSGEMIGDGYVTITPQTGEFGSVSKQYDENGNVIS